MCDPRESEQLYEAAEDEAIATFHNLPVDLVTFYRSCKSGDEAIRFGELRAEWRKAMADYRIAHEKINKQIAHVQLAYSRLRQGVLLVVIAPLIFEFFHLVNKIGWKFPTVANAITILVLGYLWAREHRHE